MEDILLNEYRFLVFLMRICDKLQNQEVKKKLEFFLNLIEKKTKCIVVSNGNFNAPGIWY